MKPEQKIHLEFCDWLGYSYPDVYFDSDPSGLRVTPSIRNILMKTRSRHAHLDIIILEPRREWKGLIIELKSETPFKQNGELKSSDHLSDQAYTMSLLESKGYKCNWAWSVEQAQQISINYLGASTVPDEPLFP